jgi:hypothetical protein
MAFSRHSPRDSRALLTPFSVRVDELIALMSLTPAVAGKYYRKKERVNPPNNPTEHPATTVHHEYLFLFHFLLLLPFPPFTTSREHEELQAHD